MDALLEQLQMVRTFVTNMHPNLRMQLAHRPMPGALLLGASTLAFLPHAGIMKSMSGGKPGRVRNSQATARWAWMHF